jgi:hypothetical protein
MMKWFKKKKKDKEPEEVVEYMSLPVSTLLRNIIYDSMLMEPESIANRLGLSPVSEDVSEMEEDASQERLEKIAPLIPLIEAHSMLSSEISLAGYSSIANIDEMDDDTKELYKKFFATISFTAAVSCVSTLVDLGLLETSILELDIYGK